MWFAIAQWFLQNARMGEPENENFYHELVGFDSFEKSFEMDVYRQLPEHWWIFITDVKGSTQAIREGRYKTVNWIGACSIVSVRNALDDFQFPFIFGGDGATILVPHSKKVITQKALLAVQNMAAQQYNLNIRVGAIQVGELLKMNANLLVAKWQMSPAVGLAMLSGQGAEVAEQLIKAENSSYLLRAGDDSLASDLNLSGLSCRWQPLPSTRGKIVTLLVQPVVTTDQFVLLKVWNDISKVLARTQTAPHALTRETLVKNEFFPWAGFYNEYLANTLDLSLFDRLTYGTKLWLRIFVAQLFFKLNLKTKKFDVAEYLNQTVVQSDFRKLDGTLRLVIDLSVAEWQEIKSLLEIRYRKRQVFFGFHLSDSALMTCALSHEDKNQHLHFLDGNDGGYTLAAVQLKAQKKQSIEKNSQQAV